MYIREDLSQKYTPLCSKISLTSCSSSRPRTTSLDIIVYCPEWFEASAVAYTLVVLGSRLARSLVGTPSHPTQLRRASACPVSLYCFVFVFVCLLVAIVRT